jgi:opine dehydrogenase
MVKTTVCICGGGSQAHISAGVIGSNPNYCVNILTRQPEKWCHDFVTKDLEGKEYIAVLNEISNEPKEIIPQSDIILICLPGYAIRSVLLNIKDYVQSNSIIGCVFGGSGFFLEAFDIFGKSLKGFALQRVPFTGRSLEYGHSAILKGYKPYLKVATTNIENPKYIAELLQDMYNTPVHLLSHYLEATLSNSNPILHPVRLYVLFKDWTPDTFYSTIPFMYNADWNDETSELWVKCDDELRAIINRLPIKAQEIPTVLDYYECSGIKELTRKIQSIEPFKNVQPHMIETPQGYQLDIDHRYFKEDIPFGLVIIKSVAEYVGVSTPNIDLVLSWAQKVMGKKFKFNNSSFKELFSC